MNKTTDDLKATILTIANEIVLQSYSERTNLGKVEEELKTRTEATIQTYNKLLSEITK